MKKFFFSVVAAVIVFLVLFFAFIKPRFVAAVMNGPVVVNGEVVAAVKQMVKTNEHPSIDVVMVESAVGPNVRVVDPVLVTDRQVDLL